MKTSILIIAHNEESHIRECIESILRQSQKADEIVLVAHNCTDTTVAIVREYPEVTLHILETSEKGPQYARKYGFEKVTGDIIACIDGDGYATPNWLEELIKPFGDPQVTSVSGFPILLASSRISYIWFLQGLPILKKIFPFYFWGGNFACRKSAYQSVGGIDHCRDIAKALDLHYPAEDCILSFLMQQDGNIAFARKAKSDVSPGRFFDGTDRGKKQQEDLEKITKYFGK